MERLKPADTQRHLRAMEVFEATGEPLSRFQAEPGTPILKTTTAKLILAPKRETLYQRCEDRFDMMLEAGALDEARALNDKRFSQSLPVMKALGAAELIAHLEGDLAMDDAIELAKRNTRRFAKRQMTWFRNQHIDWPVVEDGETGLESLMVQWQDNRTARSD